MTPRIGNQSMPHNYTYTNNNLQPIVAACALATIFGN